MATTTGTAEPEALAAGDGVRRRDFINIAAVSAAGVGGVATLIPLISQMAPSKDVLAESTTELDISAIEPGMAIKAVFRKQPVFVRNLTPQEIQAADAVPVDSLRDPQTLAERTKEGHGNIARHDGRVHPSRLRAAGRRRRREPRRVRRLFLPVPRLALRHRRRASAKAPRRRTSKCRNTHSRPTPRS